MLELGAPATRRQKKEGPYVRADRSNQRRKKDGKIGKDNKGRPPFRDQKQMQRDEGR